MRTDRYLIALALAVFTVSASAATVCVQNKQTGKYEPKNPRTGNAADCTAMNASTAAAIVQAGKPASPAGPATPPGQAPAPAAVQGVPAPTASLSPNPARPQGDPALQTRHYRLKFSDVTVRLGMERWLKEVGMQLAYEAQKDFPVPVEGDYFGPVSTVVQGLMKSLSESSYPLRACEYDNRVVLVVHRDDKCPLEEK